MKRSGTGTDVANEQIARRFEFESTECQKWGKYDRKKAITKRV